MLCCCHVMYKLLYPSIRVRTAPPVLVMVRVRVSYLLTYLLTYLVLVLVLRCNAIAHAVLHVSRYFNCTVITYVIRT